MVEIFKTNVQRARQANQLVSMLLQHFPDSKINFDMQDGDKILRIEGKTCNTNKIIMLVTESGFTCRLLQ